MSAMVQALSPEVLTRKPVQSAALALDGNPAELLRIAVSQNADLDKLSRLMDLQERWEKNEARKAFVSAMSDFKAHAIRVVRDKTNAQYQSKYVSLGVLVGTVTPFLSQHNLSARWEIDQTSGVRVSCIVTHAAGHSESVSMVCPPDKSGSKNPIQEIKSAITYAKGCTFESICGLASTDANLDDDGNGGPANRAQQVCEEMQAAATYQAVLDIYKPAYQEAALVNDLKTMALYIRTKESRKKELAQ